jgi:NAD(P)-dependent dehydrogenase (short-subunit alcohol dehydrogenase family)
LGKESLLALAKHNPAHLYFTGRNAASADSVLATLKDQSPSVPVTFVACDLTSLASIQDASKKITASTDRLDVLMCNAGIMAVPAALTKEDYEIQWGTNHVGHALLIKLLLPLIQKTGKLPDSTPRILLLSSEGHFLAPKEGIDFAHLKEADYDMGGALGSTWTKYGQSKLANLLYATQLSKRYPEIISVSIHPGVVGTGLVGNLGGWNKAIVYLTSWWQMKTPAEGAKNQVWAATVDKAKLEPGKYYVPVGKVVKSNKEDEVVGDKLWEWTEKELEGYST